MGIKDKLKDAMNNVKDAAEEAVADVRCLQVDGRPVSAVAPAP